MIEQAQRRADRQAAYSPTHCTQKCMTACLVCLHLLHLHYCSCITSRPGCNAVSAYVSQTFRLHTPVVLTIRWGAGRAWGRGARGQCKTPLSPSPVLATCRCVRLWFCHTPAAKASPPSAPKGLSLRCSTASRHPGSLKAFATPWAPCATQMEGVGIAQLTTFQPGQNCSVQLSNAHRPDLLLHTRGRMCRAHASQTA